VTLSRNQLVLIILLLVVAAAVGIAIYYVENLFKEREKQADLIREGRTEELFPAPPPAPPGSPPLERPTSRGTEVLALFEPGAQAESAPGPFTRQIVSIRGNGEFVRLPALPDEPGPVVTGILDRARVDELIRAAAAAAVGSSFGLRTAGDRAPRPVADGAAIHELRTIAGKQMNKSAAPEKTFLRMATTTETADTPWPFARQKPESFAAGAILIPESDRMKFREGVLKLLTKDARFSHQDKTWQVAGVVLVLHP
jgi:hypothetical protein